MKFEFRGEEIPASDDYWRNDVVHGQTAYWSRVLMRLRSESGLPLFNDKFEAWVKDTWNITILHEDKEFPSHLTGVELDDAIYTMLLLKYPT